MAHVAELGVERSRRWNLRRRHDARLPVPFPGLVHVHAVWRDALEGRREPLHDIDRRYHELRAAFERRHGAREYWCERVASAAVLTSQQGRLAFHRVSDWATEGRPEVARTTSRFYALLVIAFLAGFSERWAQDTLTSLAPAGAAPTGAKPSRAARAGKGAS